MSVQNTFASGTPSVKKRSSALTIWLVILMIGAAWSALANIGLVLGSAYLFAPAWVLFFIGLVQAANVVLLVWVWKWKRSAFHGLLAIAGMVCLLQLAAGLSFLSAVMSFVGVAILYVLMRPQWDCFE